MIPITITINREAVEEALQKLVTKLANPTLPMAGIAGELRAEAQKNFQDGGRPAWTPHSPSTQKRRPGGQILKDKGHLRDLFIAHTEDTAIVGSNLDYAAIHQFGGIAGRKEKKTRLGEHGGKRKGKSSIFRTQSGSLWRRPRIPARPYMPITADGQLQPEAEAAIRDMIDDHIARMIGK